MDPLFERNQKLEQQRQLMELRMRQRRQSIGMVHASDMRNKSANKERYCYDGPMSMVDVDVNSDPDPDQVISLFSTKHVNEHTESLKCEDLVDVEDQESTSVPDSSTIESVVPFTEQSLIENQTSNDSVQEANGDIEGIVETFVVLPAKENHVYKCRIIRERKGMDRGLFPTYYLHLEQPNGQRLFLLASRKRKKSTSSHYIISTNETDLSRHTNYYIGKLRSNLLGTQFTAYDNGISFRKRNSYENTNEQQELVAVVYDTNVLGFKGPRKMTILLPGMTEERKRVVFSPRDSSDSLLECWKSNQNNNLIVLHNKTPTWNDDTQSYVLNFHGRVTQASVKNFQMVHDSDPNYIVMQFGRIGEDEFTLDYRYPVCALQAFAIALSSFDSKIACE